MIVDLNLVGKRVLVVGGGNESSRKVEALLSQQCKIFVIAEKVELSIKQYADEGKICLVVRKIENANFLNEYQTLHLILATTDDLTLNREIITIGKKKHGCYVYSADDPQMSDFSHPSVINIKNTIQVGISTGGRSPLVGSSLRRHLEPIVKKSISDLIIFQIKLQEQMREKAKNMIPAIEYRKKFLVGLLYNETINQCLEQKKISVANGLAYEQLDLFIKKNSNLW
jgi:precorrin-2 dehydrogenase / sirohydrochlorin ferrochelatase